MRWQPVADEDANQCRTEGACERQQADHCGIQG
jgi:hypothetical protein